VDIGDNDTFELVKQDDSVQREMKVWGLYFIWSLLIPYLDGS